MHKSFLVHLIAFAGILLAGASIYFGAILPFSKSKAYIAAERNLSKVRNVPEFIANFDKVVKFDSPVGEEEVAKYLGGKILDVITSLDLPEKDTKALAEYADQTLFKDEVRHLMLSGHMYTAMWEKFNNPEYLDLAEERFAAAHEIGPKLPTPLYALRQVYLKKGEEAKRKEIEGRIIELWPVVKDMPGYFD